jgi:hypothetical protein
MRKSAFKAAQPPKPKPPPPRPPRPPPPPPFTSARPVNTVIVSVGSAEAYDIPSAFGSSESNGLWPYILRALKCPERSLPDHEKKQKCWLIPR